MRPIEDFLPDILPYAPSAPEPTVLKHVRDICREFCEATKSWRETDSFTIAEPSFEGLCTIADADIEAIEACRLDGTPLRPVTIAELDELHPGWSFATEETSAARYVTQLQPNSLTVVPHQGGLLELRLVLKPSKEALAVPDWLISSYGTEIGKGAAARLLVMPGTEYSNPQLGGALLSEFDTWRAAMGIKVRKGQQGGRIRTRGRYF